MSQPVILSIYNGGAGTKSLIGQQRFVCSVDKAALQRPLASENGWFSKRRVATIMREGRGGGKSRGGHSGVPHISPGNLG